MIALPDRLATFLRQLPFDGGALVAAVSGGPDSVALLRALAQLERPLRPEPIIVAHFNHRLRGDESDADEQFVRQLAEWLVREHAAPLVYRSGAADVRALAREQRDGIESAARAARYHWLAEVAREMNAHWVATGHTADDQAETVLHRLLRGTGLKGLRGIAARRPLAAGVEVIRPLLDVRRAEVLRFLGEVGQDFRYDSSNDDPRFTRTRIRRDLLPYLAEHFNPGIVEALCRLAAQAQELYREEEAAAGRLLAAAELPRAGRLLVFDAARLRDNPPRIVREMFRRVWEREGWPMGEMGYREWERVAAVALGKFTAADLPGRVRVRRKGRVVQVGEW